jgi:hypothetical protein
MLRYFHFKWDEENEAGLFSLVTDITSVEDLTAMCLLAQWP